MYIRQCPSQLRLSARACLGCAHLDLLCSVISVTSTLNLTSWKAVGVGIQDTLELIGSRYISFVFDMVSFSDHLPAVSIFTIACSRRNATNS